MSIKNSEQRIQTEKNIENAYWRCLEKNTSGETTVKKVMEVAGYDRSTFYLYFDNLSELSKQAEDDLLKELSEITNHVIQNNPVSAEMLETILKEYFRGYKRELTVMLTKKNSASFMRRFQEILKPMVYVIPELPKDDDHISLICLLVSSSLMAALEYLCLNENADPDQTSHLLHSYIHSGVPGLGNAQGTFPEKK